MDFLERMAEEKILEAMARGEFDDLPRQGQPLPHDDAAVVPPELRVAYKILKNNGFLPPEMELRKEVLTLRDLLNTVADEDERLRMTRVLNERVLRLNELLARRGRRIPTEDQQVYLGKLRRKMVESK